MSAKPLDRKTAQEALDAVCKHGTESAGAAALGIPRGTMEGRVQRARQMGLKPSAGLTDNQNPLHLKRSIKELKLELGRASNEALDAETVKRKIIGLKDGIESLDEPEWLIRPKILDASPGVPTLFLSDLHWGEVVQPSQIMNKNKYNLDIANKRLKACVETAIQLLKVISPKMDYPGIVVPLGGDMVSGNIHEELQATNELDTMPTVLDLYGALRHVIETLADTFGKVFLPCVTGNHGRDTQKTWNKDRHHTSFDWLLYCFLAKHFEKDRRVQFLIPDGPDALYRVFDHRFLLTHGDQFRGGDGMIGALGPLMRGSHKKLSRNAQIGMEFDTMICGHWHQYIHLSRLIVNGALKGLDEYAFNNNFPFEQPQQALWLNHPKHGITFRMPVFVGEKREVRNTAWVAMAA